MKCRRLVNPSMSLLMLLILDDDNSLSLFVSAKYRDRKKSSEIETCPISWPNIRKEDGKMGQGLILDGKMDGKMGQGLILAQRIYYP